MSDEALYHVTYFVNLDGIAEQGLVPGAGDSIGSRSLAGHKRGRVFLTEKEGVKFWMGRAEEWAEHRVDYPLEDGLVPVVLRIAEPWDYIDGDLMEEDEIGTRDAGGADAWFCACSIDPEALEVWDGGEWLPIDEWDSIDLELGVDSEGFLLDTSRSPLRPNPAPAIPPMPANWWKKKAPTADVACYKTKTDALNAFLQYNWRIVEEVFRGPDYNHGSEGFDNINHEFGLKGKRRVDTLAKAAWWSLKGPKPWCLVNIDVDQLNDTDIAARAEVSFQLPSHAEEQQLLEEQEQWWRDQGTEPRRWKCAYPTEEEVPF